MNDDDEPMMAPVDYSDLVGIKNEIRVLKEEVKQIYSKNKKEIHAIDL